MRSKQLLHYVLYAVKTKQNRRKGYDKFIERCRVSLLSDSMLDKFS